MIIRNHRLRRTLRKIQGFSLLELSIVLTVMSIMLSSAITIAIKKTDADREEQTDERMEIIKMALSEFVRVNKRMPCPAQGSLALTNANFGLELVTKNAANDVADCDTADHGRTAAVSIGVVPVRSLGLADEVMMDGWGRRISYVVDEVYINNHLASDSSKGTCDGVSIANCSGFNEDCDGSTDTDCFWYDTAGGITIGSNAGASDISTETVYVLISYGENGHGAYPRNGGTLIDVSSTDAEELENAEEGVSFDVNFVTKTSTDTYDDIIEYKEKAQIIAQITDPLDVDSLIDEDICNLAQDVVENPTTNAVCPGLVDGTPAGTTYLQDCLDFAADIDRVCAGYYN